MIEKKKVYKGNNSKRPIYNTKHVCAADPLPFSLFHSLAASSITSASLTLFKSVALSPPFLSKLYMYRVQIVSHRAASKCNRIASRIIIIILESDRKKEHLSFYNELPIKMVSDSRILCFGISNSHNRSHDQQKNYASKLRAIIQWL